MQTPRTQSIYEKVEEELDLSNLSHFEFLSKGGIKGVPVFSNDPPFYYSEEQLNVIHPKLGFAVNKMQQMGVKHSSIISCLEATCKLWDLDPHYMRYDTENGLWITWDSLRDNRDGNGSLRRRYLVGGNYDGLPVVSEVYTPSRKTQSWVAWEQEYPGLSNHYLAAESLGLDFEEIAKYCFQQMHYPQVASQVDLPNDGLALE